MRHVWALAGVVALGLSVPELLNAWSAGLMGVLNHHGKLAERAEKCQRECELQSEPGCIPLPRPSTARCEQEVDDSVLFRALRQGASEPDKAIAGGGDGTNSPKHSYNTGHEEDWNSSIREALNLFASAKIDAGAGLEAIATETKRTRDKIKEITCNSAIENYKDLWKRFGRLSHYPADLASPLHAYSVGINGIYHEGDRDAQNRWYKGLWDIGGKAMHGLLEVEMGRAVEFEELQCTPLIPETVARNAREVMRQYRGLTAPVSGYEGLIKDYTNGQFANHHFFASIGPRQAGDALGGILYSWQDVLKDFQPPANCKVPPPIGCGDCGGGECRPPGGDHPDEMEGVPSSSNLLGSQELLDQSWDRLAVKKNKKSLVWFWMQDYLLGEYRTGGIEEETYLILSGGYELGSEVAWELFHDDYVTTPDVAIFGRGFALSMSDLIQRKFNEPIRRYKPNDFSREALTDYPLLIIPSGGLVGIESSSFFKANLEEYVRLGGTLIVFAQQHGYEFSVLPVPEEADGTRRRVNGYGWAEDHSCFRSAAFIDTWHQMLAGLTKATPDLNVDGYFTEYPSNSTVLLRRTANGQPAMLMYEYGLGRVIVTSMYSDFASQHNQASSEEAALVRDMITWAKRPQTLPQVSPGQEVTLEIEAVNHTNRDASVVKLKLYDPGRSALLGEQILDQQVPAGASSSVRVTFSTNQDGPTGIYHVDYVLLDTQGIIVQPEAETDSGRFVVGNPPPDAYRSPNFSFSVQSDSEHYLPGSSVRFTFNLWNNTEMDRQITTHFILPHNRRREENTSTVPARGHTSFTYVLEPVRNTDRVWAYFRDEKGKNVGFAAKGIWVVVPDAALGLQVEKSKYEKGERVLVSGSVENKVVLGWPAEARISVTDPQKRIVFEDFRSLELPAGGNTTLTSNFTIPESALPGTYFVDFEARYEGKRVSVSSARFDIPQSRVTVRPELPAVYNSGVNTIAFTLKNQGQVNVRSGILEANLKKPGGDLIWSQSLPFTLAIGEEKILPVPVVFPTLKLGTYILSYTQSDETRVGSPTAVRITNNTIPIMSASLDKTSYRVRDEALLTVNLINNGQFALDQVAVTASLAGTTQAETRFVSLPPGESSQLAFPVSIPPEIPPGRQKISVEAVLAPQAVLRKEVSFNLPASRILVDYSGPASLSPGETVHLVIQNVGGVDTTYIAESISLKSAEGLTIWEGNGAGDILSGESKTLAEIPVPGQTAGGPVTIRARVTNNSTQEVVLFDKSVRIEGLTAGLETRTNKDVYLVKDSASALTTVTNGPLALENGTITVAVSRVVPGSVLGFRVHYPMSSYNKWTTRPQAVAVAGDGRLFVPEGEKDRLWERSLYGQIEWTDIWNGFSEPRGIAVSAEGSVYVADAEDRRVLKYEGQSWAEDFGGGFNFVEPSGVALGSDGYVYIVDSGLHQVLKFDPQGNLVGQWGESGQAQEQMLNPRAIAVSREGRILVADTGNHRIQVFDNQGNFLFSVGGQGTDEGRFLSPQGVALGPEDTIYVADTGNNRIQVFDRDGNFIVAWGEQGKDEGQLSSPKGLTVGPDGTVYVADTLNSRIQAFDQSGNYLFSWAIGYCEPTCGACEEIYPGYCDYLWGYCREKELFYCQEQDYWSFWFEWGSAMAVSPKGTLYAFNPYRLVIQELDIFYGQVWVLGEWGAGQGQFQGPKGMAVGPDGSIYVADTGNNRVQRFDKEGSFLGGWGNEGDGQGEFRSPEGIAVSWDGKVFVADTGNHRIQVFDSEGMFLAGWGHEGQAPGEFSSPSGIAVGPMGYVYVADTGNNRIQRFDTKGHFLGEFGTPGSGRGELNAPTGIAAGTWGSVYVIDSGNNRVVRFDRDGNFQDEWMEHECNYGDVDECSQAFRELNSIASGPEETIYLADQEKFYISLNADQGVERIFETTYGVSLSPGETRQFTDSTGPLPTPGKYLLEAAAQNSLSQVLARATYPFYVAEQDIVLTFEPERKIYRPGELIRISGMIQNRAPASASGLTLYLFAQNPAGERLELLSQALELPAGGSLPISVSMTAGEEGNLLLTGLLLRQDTTLVEVLDRLEVEEPRVYKSLEVPQVVGDEPFPIRVDLANPGRLPVSVGLEIREEGGQVILAQDLNLQGGEKKFLETLHQIQKDTELSLVFTGDVSGSETRKVLYGLGAQVQLSPQPLYPEGPVAIEVSLVNTGLLDETLTVDYQVSPGGIEILRTYAIAAGGTAYDTLYFILPEGSYSVTASCPKLDAWTQSFFQVRGENRVGLNLSAGAGGEGFVPISAQVSNLGANELGLSLAVEVKDESGGAAWGGGRSLPALIPGSSESIDFPIPAATLAPGSYSARVSVLSNSGELLASAEEVFTVKPPLIKVVQAPSYQTFQPGQEAVFRFRLKNTGDQGSSFSLKFKAEDLADSSEQGWLGAGEEKEVLFGALLPEDLDERDHFGTWELVASGPVEKGTVRYGVAGLNLTVTPSLDKPSYREGDTARLTLEIQTSAPSPLSLVAQVNYGVFQEGRPFTLAGSQSLVFEIPLPSITNEKVFLGIYRQSGRSVYLNSLYIHKAGDLINLTTDKQVYKPGDTVVVTVEGQEAGELTLTGPGGYTERFSFPGFASRSFMLPSPMPAGTYEVSAQLTTADSGRTTASRSFDVAGIQVKVKEAALDKARYSSTDTINLSLWVESNESLNAMIRTWVMDPKGEYTEAGEIGVNLTSGEPVQAKLSVPFSTTLLGIHRLAYALFLGDLLLCSGAEAFDVGKALLLGVRTDKVEYASHTEPVQVEASFLGEGEGTLEILLDGVSQAILPVTLQGGGKSLRFTVPSTAPGPHEVKAILEMEGLTSVKEASFVYGTQLPDLSVELRGSLEAGQPPQASLSIEIRNQGKGNSPPTTLALYDEAQARFLGSFEVGPLAQGQTQNFYHTTQLTGAPGPITFLAKVDPQAQVPEFQEENNDARLSLVLPELWLETSTEKESYYPGETVHISTRILNHGTLPLQGLSLETIVRDHTGAQVFSQITGFDLAAESELTLEVQWPIPSGLSWGTYVLEQQVAGKSLVSRKTISLVLQETGFSLSTDAPSRKVEAGEAASWVLFLNPTSGFEGDVSLSVSGMPPNSALVLIPNPVRLSGGLGAQAALKVITTPQSPPGVYSLNVTASSARSQSSIHVSLEIVDFSISITPLVESVRQLEKAVFEIRTSPLGSFDGPVSFFVNGIPKGVRAELSATETVPGEEVALEVLATKWAFPGEYSFEVTARGRVASHSVQGRLAIEANPRLSLRILASCFRDQKGRSIIKSFTPEGRWLGDYLASSKGGAVSLASGDLDGDGLDELVVGTPQGGIFSPAKIKVLGRDGKLLAEAATEHRGWLHPPSLAVGDLDGDWKEEIIVGLSSREEPKEEAQEEQCWPPGVGQGVVKVYKFLGGRLVETGLRFVPFPEQWAWRAPNVAVGDINGDGRLELITAPGPTPMAPALVRIFGIETQEEPSEWEVGPLTAEWEVKFSPSHGAWVGYGANVSAADVDCDGRDEIILGAPPSPRAKGEVVVLRPEAQQEEEQVFLAFSQGRGVYVAGKDLDADGCAEMVAGQGPGPKGETMVRIFRGDGSLVREFQAGCQPAQLGVRVGVGAMGD